MSTHTSSWPLILIALAMAGAGISYHFTLDARFTALEQKLDANSIALQQYQISQESALSAKGEVLTNLSKEVDTLQATLAPLGKANQDQTDSLAQIRHQIASLGQLQLAQQDADKKLADYAGQLEKIKQAVQTHEAQASAGPADPVPPSVPLPANAPVSVPIPAAAPATPTHASTTDSTKPPVAPRTETASVDLRPADIAATPYASVRAVPVALPVDASLSDNR